MAGQREWMSEGMSEGRGLSRISHLTQDEFMEGKFAHRLAPSQKCDSISGVRSYDRIDCENAKLTTW